jgi:predicted dehydrogenase
LEKLRVAVIGAGYWGPNLIRNFSACPLTEVVAICDADPARLEAVGRQCRDAKLVTSIEQLVEMPLDAVAIATPVSTHFSIAARCLEAGLHVMVEKPLAASVQEAQCLVIQAQRSGRVLMVDHTYLFSNPVRLIKALVQSGELGDLIYVDSVRINLGLFQRDVNVIWDLAPHDLSIIDHVLDVRARSISASGCGHVDSEIEDLAYVNVDFGNAMMANIHVNWLSPVKVRQMIFAGTRKSLIFNELNTFEPIKIYDRGIELAEGLAESQTVEQRRRLLVNYRSGDIISPQVEPGEALQSAVIHFARCIREQQTPISDGRFGVRVVRLLEAATRSIRAQGGRVVLEQDSNGNGESHAPSFRSGQLSANRAQRKARKERNRPLLRESLRL